MGQVLYFKKFLRATVDWDELNCVWSFLFILVLTFKMNLSDIWDQVQEREKDIVKSTISHLARTIYFLEKQVSGDVVSSRNSTMAKAKNKRVFQSFKSLEFS